MQYSCSENPMNSMKRQNDETREEEPLQVGRESNMLLGKRAWVQSLSPAWLLETLWTVACQVPLSIGFSRQEYWSRLPFPSPGDLPDPGIERASHASPALSGGFFTTVPPGTPHVWRAITNNSRENEEAGPKQEGCSAVDVPGGESKVWCYKEQYYIGTWNVRFMGQGKLDVLNDSKAEHWHLRKSVV